MTTRDPYECADAPSKRHSADPATYNDESRRATCRFCKAPIERAHMRSPRWHTDDTVTQPPPPPQP